MTDSHDYEEYGRALALVNLDAIEGNLLALKSRLPEGVRSMAVVKADAYGHGAPAVANHIKNLVDYFAVATVEEAVELRESGINTPILILSYTSPCQYGLLLDYGITQTIFSVEDAERLSLLATARGKVAAVHIAVDTGMGRIGFSPNADFADAVARIYSLKGLFAEGLFSHFATADLTDTTAVMEQKALFDSFIRMLDERGIHIPIKHISNSAASLTHDAAYDMCRFGIAMYGVYPSDTARGTGIGLTPAMKVISRVIQVKEIQAGSRIGYGHTYVAEERRVIATVSIGYADGFSRSLGGRGYVLVKGYRARVVGAVCMDQIMVDVTDIDGVSVGDSAVILGADGEGQITADELGRWCNTISYEVLCKFSRRVRRIYYKKR